MAIAINDVPASQRVEMLYQSIEDMAKENYSFIQTLSFEDGRKHSLESVKQLIKISFPELEGGN